MQLSRGSCNEAKIAFSMMCMLNMVYQVLAMLSLSPLRHVVAMHWHVTLLCCVVLLCHHMSFQEIRILVEMNLMWVAGPLVAMQAVLPPKPIQVKPGDASASAAAAAAAAAPAAAGGSGQFPPPTPLQTPPYSALRTPRTPALLDAFGKGDSTITHFAPPDAKGIVDHTLKTLGLAFNMYETYLGCKFPYKALQTVSLLLHACLRCCYMPSL